MLHPLTPLRGLKDQARVRLRVWMVEDRTEKVLTGLGLRLPRKNRIAHPQQRREWNWWHFLRALTMS